MCISHVHTYMCEFHMCSWICAKHMCVNMCTYTLEFTTYYLLLPPFSPPSSLPCPRGPPREAAGGPPGAPKNTPRKHISNMSFFQMLFRIVFQFFSFCQICFQMFFVFSCQSKQPQENPPEEDPRGGPQRRPPEEAKEGPACTLNTLNTLNTP